MSQFDQFEKIEVSPDCYYLCPPMATEQIRSDDEDLYIVDVNVTLHGNEMLLFFSCALSPQGEYYAAYNGKQTSANTMTFLVPEGSYDLCVFVGEMGSQGTETILGGNIDVTSDMTLARIRPPISEPCNATSYRQMTARRSIYEGRGYC